MVRYSKLLVCCLLSTNLLAQNFEIPEEKDPFVKIIDWKGEGAILLSKNEGETTNQTLLTFVGKENKSIWQQTMTPKSENPVFLGSDGARYQYFMDNILLDNGKSTFYQLNNAGNVKPSGLNFTVVFKKLGYDINVLKLIDIQVADRSLVYLFETFDKETKSTVLLAGLMTHNNFLLYACEVGRWEKRENQIYYGGFHEDKIAFYSVQNRNNKLGMETWFLTSKGEKVEPQFIEFPPFNGNLEVSALGPNGGVSLKSKVNSSPFLASYQGGLWSMLFVDNGLQAAIYENKTWFKKGTNSKVQGEKGVYSFKAYRLKEGFLAEQNGQMHFISVTTDLGSATYPSSKYFNPSKIGMPTNSKMVFDADSHFLIFDAVQLGKKTKLNFELRVK